MADKTTLQRGSIVKKLLVVLAVLVVLLVAVYFVATSAAFLKGVILPRVSKSVGADITVADASVHPFSSVGLQRLKVQPPGRDAILEAEDVQARYSLTDIMGGNIKVDELTIVSPVIRIVEDEKGKKNTDAVTKAEQKPQAKQEKGKTPQVDIKNVTLKNATVQLIKKYQDGHQDITEITGLNLTLDQLKNGGSGKVDIAADVKTTAAITNALAAGLAGKFDFALTQNLLPASAKGNLKLDVKKGSGTYADLNNLSIALTSDLTPTEIKQLAVQFLKGGTALGEIRASGPFDANKVEGKLNVEVASIDKQLLNVFGASQGIDFGSTKINSTNQVDISKKGQMIALNGALRADSFGITRTNQSTPKMDLLAAYDLTVDQVSSNALIKTFTITGTQNKQPLLRGTLSKLMKLDWGKAEGGVDESAFDLVVTNLNLADWKAFAPDLNASGQAGLHLTVLSQQAGKQITFDVASTVTKLSAQSGTNKIDQADIKLAANGRVNAMDKVHLEKCEVQLAQKGQQAANISASGDYGIKSGDANLKTTVEAMLPKLFQLAGSPEMGATSGTLKFNGQVKQQGKSQTIVGDMALNNFTGHYGEYVFDTFTGTFRTDIQKQEDALQIKNISGTFAQKGTPGGGFNMTGNLNSKTQVGKFDIKLNQLNKNALGPFFSPSLGEKKLVSVTLTGNVSATLNSTNDAQFKTDIVLTNFVVRDPKKDKPEPPLSAHFVVDGGMAKQVFDLRTLQVTLSPTARAKNQLNANGKIDLSKTNAISGNLAINSDALDLTDFYNVYGATNKAGTASTTPQGTGTAKPAPDQNKEPEPTKLPVGLLTADVKIGAVYLREVAISNLQLSTKVQGSKVTINPAQLTLNGAPVKATVDADLGVPGYAYNVSFSADRIPLEPLANSFIPEKRGQYQGQILASAQIKGQGMTGTSLKKTLDGNLGFTFTNANIQVVGPKMKKVLVPIATVLRVPEITSSPVNWIDSKILFGGGNINVSNFKMTSEAFEADTTGIIPIADVLTNSPINKIPVNFQLRRNLAQKVNLVPANTPADAKYVPLPNLVKVKGTLGDIQTEVNKVALVGVLGRSAGGIVGGETGQIIQGVGGILTGQKPATGTNAATTNNAATSTNKSALPSLINEGINIFKKKK